MARTGDGTREMTPGDRRELRALVKKQFEILRKDVKRREQEMRSEVETELLQRYQGQDEAIADAQAQLTRALSDFLLAVDKITDELRSTHPELTVETGRKYGEPARMTVTDTTRQQLHTALLAAVPRQVATASTALDQNELDLLRELTLGALDSDQANQFLARIPTVGQLVPRARLSEIEGAL